MLDNGPKFAGQALDAWTYAKGITLAFIGRGKPVENTFIESFDGRFRDACLNEHWLADARQTIGCWRRDNNKMRPHSSLVGLTPAEFSETHALSTGQSSSPGGPFAWRSPQGQVDIISQKHESSRI